LETLGAEAIPVELDRDGVRPDSLRRALALEPVALILQPRAQNPCGVSMAPARAEALAKVLRRHGSTWVIEDDHSGWISTAPDVSLGAWLPERVVHVRSYSKSHGPDLRVAAVGGPADLIDALVARRMLGPGWTSRMLQTILLDLLTQPAALDQVSEARRQYFARQRAVVGELAALGVDLPAPDGLNLWLPVADERAALLHLAAAGIRAAAGSAFLVGDLEVAPHVRVTTGLVTPDRAAEVAAALAGAAHAG